MFVYTPGGRDILGVSDSQMQSELASSLVTANEAMVNSDVDLQFSLVRVEPVSVQWNYIIPRACSIILVISISSPSHGQSRVQLGRQWRCRPHSIILPASGLLLQNQCYFKSLEVRYIFDK